MKWKRTTHKKWDVKWVKRFALFPTLMHDYHNDYGDNNYYVWLEPYWEKQVLGSHRWYIESKTQNPPKDITP